MVKEVIFSQHILFQVRSQIPRDWIKKKCIAWRSWLIPLTPALRRQRQNSRPARTTQWERPSFKKNKRKKKERNQNIYLNLFGSWFCKARGLIISCVDKKKFSSRNNMHGTIKNAPRWLNFLFSLTKLLFEHLTMCTVLLV